MRGSRAHFDSDGLRDLILDGTIHRVAVEHSLDGAFKRFVALWRFDDLVRKRNRTS